MCVEDLAHRFKLEASAFADTRRPDLAGPSGRRAHGMTVIVAELRDAGRAPGDQTRRPHLWTCPPG